MVSAPACLPPAAVSSRLGFPASDSIGTDTWVRHPEPERADQAGRRRDRLRPRCLVRVEAVGLELPFPHSQGCPGGNRRTWTTETGHWNGLRMRRRTPQPWIQAPDGVCSGLTVEHPLAEGSPRDNSKRSIRQINRPRLPFSTSQIAQQSVLLVAHTRFVVMSFVALACFGLVGCSTSSPTPASSASASAPSETVAKPVCTGDPTAHVYSPARLHLLVPCITLSGTIDLERPEPDGDFHVRLHLDPGQTCGGQQCLDADNISQQAGDLILEPVCENPITQADAVAACQGYHNPLVLPPLGSHVTVTGPFVLDTDHGWNEIHPFEPIAVA